MSARSPGRTMLTPEDRHYLRANYDLAPSLGEADPQAQALFAVQDNILDSVTPIWDLATVRNTLRQHANKHGIRLVVRLHPDRSTALALPETKTRSGSVLLPMGGMTGDWRPNPTRGYSAHIPLHEFAHILTAILFQDRGQYGTPTFQSHGPEFVGTYLSLLAEHGWGQERLQEALAFMGVKWITRSRDSSSDMQ